METMRINIDEYKLIQCDEQDCDDVNPILHWVHRVPAMSWTRYYGFAVFKREHEVIAAYWNNLENNWRI